MLKKISALFVAVLFFIVLPSVAAVHAQESPALADSTNIYFFYSRTCPHCSEEKPFLGFLTEEYENLQVYAYEVGERRSAAVYQKAGDILGISTGSVPTTIIGDLVVPGYNDHESTGRAIHDKVAECLEVSCEDIIKSELSEEELAIGEITFKNEIRKDKKEIEKLKEEEYGSNRQEAGGNGQNEAFNNQRSNISTEISIPFMGSVDVKDFSLPVLAIVIGLLDGFNPCAMWVLLFLISLLLGVQDKKRRWLLGITFILASGFVYFLFMTAWLNAFLFLGVVAWVRIGIALLAIGVGAYHVWEYYKYGDACHVTDNEKRQKTFEKLKEIALQKSLLPALGGIVLLAFAVNVVELMCSAGFPAIFTHVLSLSDLATWQYYFYILLYLIMFMIDDIIVFALAMITLESKLVGQQYAKYSKIIGGILMLVIGLLLLLKPEWLMFG